jgi:hypothetical protein
MTNLRWLKWKTTKYFRDQGLQIHLHSIKLGNTAIDGEVIGNGYRIALEIKTPRDDVTRGLGQLTEAIAYGYDKAALVTTLNKSKKIDLKVFVKNGFILLAADSKGKITNLTANASAYPRD